MPLQIEEWSLDRLIPYAKNPRRNDEVVDRMVGAIREFGFRIPIVATSDGLVVDGHLRLKATRRLNLEEVPMVLADDLPVKRSAGKNCGQRVAASFGKNG